MTALPEGVGGKALALGIGALLIATLYYIAIAPLLAVYADGQQQLEERAEMAARLQRSVHDLPQLRSLADQAKQKSSIADLLLPGSSDPLAAANLQSTVRALIDQNGATLTTTEVVAPQVAGNLHRVGIHVAFSANLPLLAAILKGIETARPLLFIDNLDIRGADRPDAASAEPALTVAFDVYGFPAP